MDCIDENNRRSYWSEEAESCCRSDRETGFGTHVVVTGGNTCPPKKAAGPNAYSLCTGTRNTDGGVWLIKMCSRHF